MLKDAFDQVEPALAVRPMEGVGSTGPDEDKDADAGASARLVRSPLNVRRLGFQAPAPLLARIST